MEIENSGNDHVKCSSIEQDAVNYNNQFYNNNQQQHHHNHHQELNNDLEDIDSTDDLDDDDIDYNKNVRVGISNNVSLSTISAAAGSNLTGLANNAALFIEDDKRKRRAIANSNERRRMQSINAGFQTLKSLIPHSSGEKLSKACILQRSADFMQYLSNEKDKLNNKLQSAIKLLESNGLFNQYQQIVNESATILMTQSNNNNTGSFAGTNKSISSTKINKQNFYLSTLNMNSTVVENSNSITKTIQNIPTTLENPTNSTNCTITTISTNNEKPFTLSSSSTTTTTKPNSDTNLSPISPSSTVSPQTNRKSTQISSLLNSLNNASNPITDTSSSEISNCKLLSAAIKNTTPVLSKPLMGPSSSFTASSSDSNNKSILSSSSKLVNVLINNEETKSSSSSSKIEDQIRNVSIINSTSNRQLTDTTNIKPLQPILITQGNNLVFSESYSIYDTNNSSILSINQSCNMDNDNEKLNDQTSLLITAPSTTTTPNDNILTEDTTMANLVLIDGTQILTPIQTKFDDASKNRKKMKSLIDAINANKANSKLKQENYTSVELIGLLNDFKSKNLDSGSSTNMIEQSTLKVSPTSHQTNKSESNKIKNLKPTILNSLILNGQEEKTISQILNNKKPVHSDDLIESFNEIDSLYHQEDVEDENNNNLSDDSSEQRNINTTITKQKQEELNKFEMNKNLKFSKTIQSIISLNSQQYGRTQLDKNLNVILNLKSDKIKNYDDINKTSTIVKSSRSNSIDQLIAAAAVTAQSSACMSPLSPSHSPPTPPPVSNNNKANSNSPSQSNNLLIINPNILEQDKHMDEINSTNNNSNNNNNNSVSRKNLNTIVEAIFHVEGKTLLDQLDDSEQLEDFTIQSSSSSLISTTNITNRTIQTSKPPKKRKFTTEEISQYNTNLKEDVPIKQANNYISDYYNNKTTTTTTTNQYENINKLLNNTKTSTSIKLNQNDSIVQQEIDDNFEINSNDIKNSTEQDSNKNNKNEEKTLFGVLVNL